MPFLSWCSLSSPVMNKAQTNLFDSFLVVTLHAKTGAVAGDPPQPVIDYCFPPVEKDIGLNARVPLFCYPDADEFKPVSDYKSETFSFTLTEGDGSRRFGYCRRMLPPGSGPRLPECYCIISLCGSFSLFSQVLDGVEKQRKMGSRVDVYSFLKTVLANPFPRMGQDLTIYVFGSGGRYPFTLSRPDDGDAMFEYVDFSSLFKSLTIKNVIVIFSAMMCERRVLVRARNLSALSSSVHALIAILYPFEWQHVMIPVLPKALIEYASAPMPFIIGVLDDYMPLVEKMPLEDVIIVDVERGNLLIPEECNDYSLLPDKPKKNLKRLLENCKGKWDRQEVCSSFIQFQLELFGAYKHALQSKKAFIKSQPKCNRPFLSAVQNSQLFERFVCQREELNKKGIRATGVFEAVVVDRNGDTGETLQSKIKKLFNVFGTSSSKGLEPGRPHARSLSSPPESLQLRKKEIPKISEPEGSSRQRGLTTILRNFHNTVQGSIRKRSTEKKNRSHSFNHQDSGPMQGSRSRAVTSAPPPLPPRPNPQELPTSWSKSTKERVIGKHS